MIVLCVKHCVVAKVYAVSFEDISITSALAVTEHFMQEKLTSYGGGYVQCTYSLHLKYFLSVKRVPS